MAKAMCSAFTRLRESPFGMAHVITLPVNLQDRNAPTRL